MHKQCANQLQSMFVGHCKNISNQGRFDEDLTSVNMINTEFKKYILKVARTAKCIIARHRKKQHNRNVNT